MDQLEQIWSFGDGARMEAANDDWFISKEEFEDDEHGRSLWSRRVKKVWSQKRLLKELLRNH